MSALDYIFAALFMAVSLLVLVGIRGLVSRKVSGAYRAIPFLGSVSVFFARFAILWVATQGGHISIESVESLQPVAGFLHSDLFVAVYLVVTMATLGYWIWHDGFISLIKKLRSTLL